MAITDIKVSGKVFTDAGGAVNGATVALLETGTSTEEDSTTTNSSGEWAFTETSLDATYDVKISVGSSIRYILWSDEITVTGLDAASVKVRGGADAAAPIYFFADRGDDAGDGWRIQASASNTLAIGSNKASAGTIIDYLTITNGANAAASVVALGGDLTVGDDLSLTSDSAVLNMGAGNDFTITHDGTTGATLAGNPITITSAGAGTWSTSSGALTITSAAAATWSTAAGVLTIDGDDGITLQTTGSGNVTVAEILDITDATDASNATGDTGALRTEGGASIAKKLYVGTDLDVDGTTNLDAVDIDGNVQLDGTFTVGVDDTGKDVRFFGDTSGAYFLYDESADGIIIDQSTDDGPIMEFRSSTDVAHPFTGSFNAAMYGSISKDTGGTGGLTITGIQDAGATSKGIVLYGFVGATAADTAKTTSAAGIVHVLTRVSDGSTGGANPGSNQNLMSIAGSSTAFIFDVEGDFHYDGSLVAFADEYEDAHLLRALDYAVETKGAKGLIRSKWDKFVKYSEETLIDLGILGDTIENGGLINMTALQRLHNGALWQAHIERKKLQADIVDLRKSIKALKAGV